MEPYDIIAQFYDEIMGDQADIAGYIRKFILQRNPNAHSVLEIACGTGELMKHLSRHYEVAGLDKSSVMVAMAHHKFRHIMLYQLDMVDFKLKDKFDAIICMNDSINHLLKFSDWKKLFANVAKHLKDGGIFVFDINTEFKLEELSIIPPMVHEFEDNLLIIDVQKHKNQYEWNLRIFENAGENNYIRHEETLFEKSFPAKQIKEALSQQFKKIKLFDLDQLKIPPKSERLYFVATKK